MRALPSIPARPMPAPLAAAQLQNVALAVRLHRKDRRMFPTLAPGTRVESLGTPGALGTVESSRELDHASDPCHVELIVRWDDGPLARSRIGIQSVRVADARELPVINAGCPRCGQQTLAFPGTTCATCREQDRQSQGEQHALFTPTAAPINGQQTL